MKKDLEKNHKKALAVLEKTLMKKQQKKIEPTKTNKKKKRKQRDTEKQKRKISIKQPNVRSNIIGLLLLIAGVILIIDPSSLNIKYTWALSQLFMNPDPLNLKISIVLVLIGFFLILLIHEKNTPKDTTHIQGEGKLNSAKKNRLLMSEKITTALSIWVLLLFFSTGETDFEILFVLILIGLIVVKMLTDEFTTHSLKKRLNIFIFVFLILFITIITQKIINIVNT